MSDKDKARGGRLMCAVERVIIADPTKVWALVADPARVGEWAAVEALGYMGTELPKSGQVVFVRTHRWQPRTRARRVEIEDWEAGSWYRCTLQPTRVSTAISFEMHVVPEVTGEGITSRVRIIQRMTLPVQLVPVLRGRVTRQLEKRLDRLQQAVGG